jgi:hypothetical protein
VTSRVFASLAVCLAFAGQLVATMHMGLVRHDVCAEHGELVEASAAARHNAAHPDLARAGLHDVRVDRLDSDDDHCLAVTLTQSLATFTSAALDVSHASAALDLAHAAVPVDDVVALAVLDVAPKQGPPVLVV